MFQGTPPAAGSTGGSSFTYGGKTDSLDPRDIDLVSSQKALSDYSNIVLKAFTQTRERISEIQSAIADATPNVRRLGGEIKDVSEIITQVAIESRRNVVTTAEEVEKLFAIEKALGLGADVLSKSFLDVGMSIVDIPEKLTESMNYVRSIGGNAKTVIGDVQKNMEQMNRYQFEGGVQGLTKMAAQASMLRFDIATTFKFAEDLLDPDRAIEVAAAFQRLGVTAGNLVDPFQLMNMSINDPSGLQDSIVEISKQFTEFDNETKTFKINPQGVLTLREIGKQAGLDAKELSKMGLAAAELDRRLSQISPSINIKEEDKQYLANISQMNEKGDYVVKVIDEQGKERDRKLSEITQTEFDKLITQQKTGPKTIEEVAKAQLRYDEITSKNIQAIKETIVGGILTAPTMQDMNETIRRLTETTLNTINKKFTTPELRDKSESIFFNLGDDLARIIGEGKFSPDEILTELMRGSGENFASLGSEFFDELENISSKISVDVLAELNNFKPTTPVTTSTSTAAATTTTPYTGNISVLGQTGVNPNFSRGAVPATSREPIKLDQDVKVTFQNMPPNLTPEQINEIIDKAVRKFKMALNEQSFKNYMYDPSGVYE